MIVHPNDLPSQGLDNNSEILRIEPLNFKEMIKYSRELARAKTELQKYLIDFDLIKSRIPNWRSINLMDLDYVIFLMKKVSVSSDSEFTVSMICPDCGAENTLYLDLGRVSKPTQLLFDLSGKVELNGELLEYRCPSLEEFDKILTKMTKFRKTDEIRLIKLVSMFPKFNELPSKIESSVLEAVGDDIVVLSTLESMYLDSKVDIDHKCNQCKGGDWSMGVNSLIDNVFLSLVLSTESTESKIHAKQIRGDQ